MKKSTILLGMSLYCLTGVSQVIENGELKKWENPPAKIVIPAEVTLIANGVFKENQTITSVDLNNVYQVGGSAFEKCINLETVLMPNVGIIGNRSFEGTNLKTIVMPMVTRTGAFSFYDCLNLVSVEMPWMEAIERNAFNLCSELKTVDLSKAEFLYEVGSANYPTQPPFPDIATLTIYVSDQEKITLFPAEAKYTVKVGDPTSNVVHHQVNEPDFQVYFNSGEERITITFNGETQQNDAVKMYDNMGRLLIEKEGEQFVEIQTGHLVKGVYYIRVGTKTEKVLVY